MPRNEERGEADAPMMNECGPTFVMSVEQTTTSHQNDGDDTCIAHDEDVNDCPLVV
jgi:hypothetical protein